MNSGSWSLVLLVLMIFAVGVALVVAPPPAWLPSLQSQRNRVAVWWPRVWKSMPIPQLMTRSDRASAPAALRLAPHPPLTAWTDGTPPSGLASILRSLDDLDRQFGADPFRLPLGWVPSHNPDGWSLVHASLTPGKATSMVHIGVTGQNGSGKDTAITALLLALVSRNPQMVDLVILDGKGLDYHAWRVLPQVRVLGEVPEDLPRILPWLVTERDRRRAILQEAGVKHWFAYRAAQTSRPELVHLPILVVYIAELSLLSEQIGPTFWPWLISLLAVGRAFGMHIIVASQSFSGLPTPWRRQLQAMIGLYQPSPDDDRPNMSRTTGEIAALGILPPSGLPSLPGHACVRVHNTLCNVRFGIVPESEEIRTIRMLTPGHDTTGGAA